MGIRRKSRESALRILYQCDIRGEWDARAVAERHFDQEPEVSGQERDFAVELAEGVADRREIIDMELGHCLTNWPVDRLGYMERNILRIGAFEILYQQFTPDKVAVDEAVRMTKLYCDKDSSGLVNGALQKVMDRKSAGNASGEAGAKLAV